MNRYATAQFLQSYSNNTTEGRGIQYKNVVKYPLIPQSNNDIYAITEFGDRYDNLSFQFYGDVTLWWIISTSNPNIVSFSSMFIPVGSQIRIPQNIGAIINSYKELNRL